MPNRLPVAARPSLIAGYGVALICVLVGAFLASVIEPIRERTPFMLFYAAVAVSAVRGGVGPACLATGLSVLFVTFNFFSPGAPPTERDLVNDLGFLAVCGVIIALAERAQRSLRHERAQREWSQVTLKSIGDAVMVTDAQARVLMLNAAAEALTGWPEREAIGLPVAKVFPIVNEQTRATVDNPAECVCRDGVAVALANHTLLIRRDGHETPIDDSGAPIFSEDGGVVGAVLVFRDVSDRHASERERSALLESERRARADAQAANRAKDEFLAVLSHELRTPLNAILGWTQLMRASPAAELRERGLVVIERNARRQAQLIEDVLDMSRIVSGRLSVERAPVDLQRVVSVTLDTMRPLMDAKQLTLVVSGSCGGSVLGDAQRLQQVLENLLSNAVKFTPAAGRIELSLSQDGDACVLRVSNTGEGITPEFLPHVFDRFRQEDAGRGRRYGGLGLGLTIVRHLVEAHGGSVRAESAGAGCGATFTVRLPLAAERQSDAPAHASVSLPSLAGIRVLAVDDEADSRELVAELLREAGAEVHVAASAVEALERLGALTADVIVADLEMPHHDGYALLERVRKAGHGTPLVAVTAHSSVEDRLRALAAGFAEHVAKPIDSRQLRVVVARAATNGR